jgi:hypothetical protein
VDVYDCAGIVEDLVERAEPGIVAPAVDEGSFKIADLLPKPFGDEL